MARKTNRTICGVPAVTGAPINYDLVGPYVGEKPDRRALGSYVTISKPEAKRIVEALFGPGTKPPRVNTSIQLCDKQTMDNMNGSFQVTRHGDGEIRGARRKRRRR